MSTKVYNELVRDKVAEIMEANGSAPKTRILDKAEYLQALIEKLFIVAEAFSVTQSIEELADLQEVLLALADAIDVTPGELAKTYLAKAANSGAYKKRIFLESVDTRDD